MQVERAFCTPCSAKTEIEATQQSKPAWETIPHLNRAVTQAGLLGDDSWPRGNLSDQKASAFVHDGPPLSRPQLGESQSLPGFLKRNGAQDGRHRLVWDGVSGMTGLDESEYCTTCAASASLRYDAITPWNNDCRFFDGGSGVRKPHDGSAVRCGRSRSCGGMQHRGRRAQSHHGRASSDRATGSEFRAARPH